MDPLALHTALAAAELSSDDICFVGIGIPSLAAMTAKRHFAAGMTMIYESGAIGSAPSTPPLSTGSPSVVERCDMVTSCLGVFSMLHRGHYNKGLLSAAQVDRFGNLNSTRIARPGRPDMPLVGSGGAHDIALHARQVIILMPHDPRRFVTEVDFRTSPGLPEHATDAPRGNGPSVLLTPRARFTFDAGELTLDRTAPGTSIAQALEGFGWPVPHPERVEELPMPEHAVMETAEDLVAQWQRQTGGAGG